MHVHTGVVYGPAVVCVCEQLAARVLHIFSIDLWAAIL